VYRTVSDFNDSVNDWNIYARFLAPIFEHTTRIADRTTQNQNPNNRHSNELIMNTEKNEITNKDASSPPATVNDMPTLKWSSHDANDPTPRFLPENYEVPRTIHPISIWQQWHHGALVVHAGCSHMNGQPFTPVFK
jgi:hypothetical protein